MSTNTSPKKVQSNSNGITSSTANGLLQKRKKNNKNRGTYINKWLDKTMQHIQESTPNLDSFNSCTTYNIPTNNQFSSSIDAYKYNVWSSEPSSLPTLPSYINTAPVYPEYTYGTNENKTKRARPKKCCEKAEEIHSTPLSTPNGTLKANFSKTFNESQDYTSLPPIVTSAGDTTSNSDMNNEKECSNARRFSDPCVQGLPDVARPANGDADTESECSTGLSESQLGGRLFSCLLDQITTLKIANERLNKELVDTKAELNLARQQNAIWQKSPNNSFGFNHSTLSNNGLLGPGYSPGVLTDLVREIRDAARLREDAMYARVKSMMHDRNDNTLNLDAKYSDRSLDDIKNTIRSSEMEKRRMMQRINKLEDELRSLRIANGIENIENHQIEGPADKEVLRLRKELVDAKKEKQSADNKIHKLEMLVTQMQSHRSTQLSPNAPESLTSETEHEPNRLRRTSVNSCHSVTYGHVTNL